MMKRGLLLILALGLTGSTLVASDVGAEGPGSRRPKAARDTNRRAVNRFQAETQARAVFDRVMSTPETAGAMQLAADGPGAFCALAVIPGPAGGFDIRFSIFNLLGDAITDSTIDSFLSLGGDGLIHASVFATTPPAGGTLTVDYPTPPPDGRGPIVLSFTGFGPLNAVAFNSDPDTYTDPSFGATVLNMNRTVIEVAYANGRRCRGALAFNFAANASIAFLTQTSALP